MSFDGIVCIKNCIFILYLSADFLVKNLFFKKGFVLFLQKCYDFYNIFGRKKSNQT